MALQLQAYGVWLWSSKARVVCLRYVGSESVGPVDAIRRSVWLARRGGGSGSFGAMFVVYGWSSCVVWATRHLDRAALRLMTEQGSWSGGSRHGCVCFVQCWPFFSSKTGSICTVFGPGFSYKLG